MIQAVIMAGGAGSRLRPLTCDLPKPMARLCGRPNIEYILDLLAEHSITEAAVTVQYLAQRIEEHFESGEYRGVRLRFVREEQPLGTAGSVKNAVPNGFQGEACLVISGDAMCDFDLTAALRRHKEANAAATIVVKAVEDPREYGLVDTDPEGMVRGFVEKPCFSQAVSNLANTGVYILSPRALEQIPCHRFYDFAKDLFPRLLEKRWKIAAYEDRGYWCDIGDIESYRRCQRDMLEGKVRCRIEGERDQMGNIFAGPRPRGSYRLSAPVYVGAGVELGDGALVEAGSVIDRGCSVGPDARVTASVLLPGSLVERGSSLTGAVVCAGATVRRKAMLFENAVLGADATAGEGSTIRPGVRVWAGKAVEAGVTLRDNLQHGAGRGPCFEDDGLGGAGGLEFTPELALRLGLALGSCGERRIGVGGAGDPATQVMRQALIAGVLSTGCDVLDFGPCFESLFRFDLSFCGVGLGVYLGGGEEAGARLFTFGGLPATRAQERSVEGALQRGEYRRSSREGFGDSSNLTGMKLLYENELLKYAPFGLSGLGVAVKSPNRELQTILRGTLERLGAEEDNSLTLQVSADGGSIGVSCSGLGYLSHGKVLALCCLREFQRGRAVALPYESPRALDELAAREGGCVERYLSCPADHTDDAARELACRQLWSRDALMLAVRLLAWMKEEQLAPEQLFHLLPEYDVASVLIKTGRNPADVLRALAQSEQREGDGIGEGVVLRDPNGVVLIRPLKRGGGLRVLAEAHSSEIAMELCAQYEKQIKPLLADSADR
ncbi:NTP transferase domain-containing protein [Clostridiaceae bacterium NSJ-31]|uniref:NTP transferase domain-containing protein n=1 Tax=Ligaoa zhengdingensis TaxID=2763658 RepID=A0A926I454_9FIRM|nr:sugar phosphate nucleotidyltransferase [Ligaoa zhengdingensis]MBC8545856.1 NTP transferase domain-containing protein [Ligaoa zhengdingensis]